jgi:hypothetical protein
MLDAMSLSDKPQKSMLKSKSAGVSPDVHFTPVRFEVPL